MINADNQYYIHIDKKIFYCHKIEKLKEGIMGCSAFDFSFVPYYHGSYSYNCKERKYNNEPCIMTKPLFDEIMDYICLLCWEKQGSSFTFNLNVQITDLFYRVKTLFLGSKAVFTGEGSTRTANEDSYVIPKGITIEYHYLDNSITLIDNNWKYDNVHHSYRQQINKIQVITINVATDFSEKIYRDIQSFIDRVLQNTDILFKISDSILRYYESSITTEINGKIATGHAFFVNESGIFAYKSDRKKHNCYIDHIIDFAELKRMELQSVVERLGFIIALGNYRRRMFTIRVPGIIEYGDDIVYRPNLIYEYYTDFKDKESSEIKKW